MAKFSLNLPVLLGAVEFKAEAKCKETGVAGVNWRMQVAKPKEVETLHFDLMATYCCKCERPKPEGCPCDYDGDKTGYIETRTMLATKVDTQLTRKQLQKAAIAALSDKTIKVVFPKCCGSKKKKKKKASAKASMR